MKRFYCTVCEKVRRVRKLPVIIHQNLNEKAVIDRFGECDKHHTPRVIKFSQVREQPVFAATTTKKAGKRGR